MKSEWNTKATEPNVCHKVKNLNDDDASMCMHGNEFTVELRSDGFQDAKEMSEQEVDINASTIIGTGQNTKTKSVKQVLSWRPAGNTLVRLEQARAAELATNTDATTKTMRNNTEEFSWERAKARSVEGVTEDTANSIHKANRIGDEALIERTIPGTVDVNSINTVMNSADKKISSSEEPEFVWTFPDPQLKPTSARNADVDRMDQDSDDHKCFCCVSGRLGVCVNDVGCTKQDVISLIAQQHEFYTWITCGARTSHTNCLDRDCIKRCMTKMEMMTVGGLGWRTVCLLFRALE